MTNQVNQAFEKCDCLNFCGDDRRISKCKVEPCQDYKKPSAMVSAKRVYTAGYGSVETGEIDITATKESNLKEGDFLYSKCSVIQMIEAATQSRDSEINSLKQRVELLEAQFELDTGLHKLNTKVMLELTSDNKQLREKLEKALTSLEESQEKECRCDYTR